VFARIAAVIFQLDPRRRLKSSQHLASALFANDAVSEIQYSLYLLRCADNSLYTGIAIDVDKRLLQHDGGERGAKYLRGRSPFELVFQQVVGDRSLASRLEYRVKQLDRAQKEALVRGEYPLMQLLPGTNLQQAQASGDS
jgi:putative endonuclease